ncbi:D-amino-acid transaminase [Terrihabitans sp. B22-R8]|uniref:D-amino-acid transaminase n=1 Tax=Terrihabitans sp. B22-R8 TaxID=3425128 RepID=UPI00403C1DFC
MSRIVYVNGRYVPYADAAVHVEDRGFQFADSVYEVCEVRHGRIIDETRHLARLKRSLDELQMAAPMSDHGMRIVISETLRRNRVREGTVYIQVSRGACRRDFIFPTEPLAPTLVVIARQIDPSKAQSTSEAGIGITTVPESRWERVDIKTTGLLPNVLAKMRAKAQGAKEAWFVDRDGYVTEGGSSNAWIITSDGRLVTRPAESGILRGITRTTLMDLIRQEGLQMEERPFAIEEAKSAQEAFVTSATNILMPVVTIDGMPVGSGKPGPIVTRLRAKFHDAAEWRII